MVRVLSFRRWSCHATDGPPPQLVPSDHLWQFLLPWMLHPDQVWLPQMVRLAASGSLGFFTVLHGTSGIATKL